MLPNDANVTKYMIQDRHFRKKLSETGLNTVFRIFSFETFVAKEFAYFLEFSCWAICPVLRFAHSLPPALFFAGARNT